MRLKQTMFKLLFFVVAAIIGIFTAQPAYALTADWGMISSYSVDANGVLKVQHIVQVENQDSAATPATIDLSVFGSNIRGIAAETQDSTSLTAALSSSSDVISVTLPDNSGNGNQWSFSLSYDADVLEQFGDTKVLIIEPVRVGGAAINRHDVTVSIDLGLGFAALQGAKPDDSRVGIGSQILNYGSSEGTFSQGLTYYFGESSLVNATFETTLKNDSFWWQTKTVVLPPDTNQQRVLLESITPQPSKLSLDPDGNMVAEYSLSPKRQITVTASTQIGLNNLTYNVGADSSIEDIDPLLTERYTGASDIWKPLATPVDIPADASVADIIELVSRSVAESIDPNLDAKSFTSSQRGGSLGAADTLVGALRQNGIPSRVVVGRVMSNGAGLFSVPQNHAWVEAFIPNSGWITVDPVAMSRSDVFGSADILHIGLALWGVKGDYPPVDLSNWKLQYVVGEFPETAAAQPVEISATKTVILPGVSLLSIDVAMPAGQIIDGVAVQGPAEKIYEYGSLAPLQRAGIKSFQLGASSLSSDSFRAGSLASGLFVEQGDVIASSLNVVPIAIIMTVLLSGAVAAILVRRARRKDSYSRSSDAYIMHEERQGSAIEHEDLLLDNHEDLDDFNEHQPTQHQPQHLLQSHVPVVPRPSQQASSPPQQLPVQRVAVQSQSIGVAYGSEQPVRPAQPVPPKAPLAGSGSQIPVTRHTRVVARSAKNDTIAPTANKQSARRPRMVQG